MRSYTKRAFTLIELLVVIAIIGMLTAVLVPALARAKKQGQSAMCLSNLRQFLIAAGVYTSNNDGFYPLAYKYSFSYPLVVSYAWDFTSSRDWDTGEQRVTPGLLWQGDTIEKVHQCPSFKGDDNWIDDPYTGYNYNTSYIGGHGMGASAVPSARDTEVRQPSGCAIFGDGGIASGSNKFMRSPWPSEKDDFYARYAGTQAYRHIGRTNVGYGDGSASTTKLLFRETHPDGVDKIAPGTGFLSADNGAYDLK